MPAVPPVILRVRHAVDLPDDPWYVITSNQYYYYYYYYHYHFMANGHDTEQLVLASSQG